MEFLTVPAVLWICSRDALPGLENAFARCFGSGRSRTRLSPERSTRKRGGNLHVPESHIASDNYSSSLLVPVFVRSEEALGQVHRNTIVLWATSVEYE